MHLTKIAFASLAVVCSCSSTPSAGPAPSPGAGAALGGSASGGARSAPSGQSMTGTTGGDSTSGSTPPAGGTATIGGASGYGGGSELGGAGTMLMGGAGGAAGAVAAGPYAPRSGSFKMLVYSSTRGYRHYSSIDAGKIMLQQIANEQNFELTLTENNDLITPAGLANYEIIFMLNPTGDIFNDEQQSVFVNWLTNGGAIAGTHSMTDTEKDWPFYTDMVGQSFERHVSCCDSGRVDFEPGVGNHPALAGLPSPWTLNEEWYFFSAWPNWINKPGFKVLGRVTSGDIVNQPIMWTREWNSYRLFYTALGHEAFAFEDPNVKKHITGGIMWAVRRDHLIR
ncbi:MAG: ThuA domain-containing protein [Polyangiaceae bacterium]|nr:ThuA domain-containing protein [Polyangiaceae bacterium]